MENLSLSVEFLRSRRNAKWHRFDDRIIPAWVAEMDFPVAPPIQAAVQRVADEQDYGYPLRDGDRPDRLVALAFTERMRSAFGWEPDPDSVQPVADLVQAMFATILAYSEPGEGVVLQTPAYPPFREAIDGTGRRLIDNPMVDSGSRFAIDLPGLRDALDEGARIIMLCSPHNPTGRVFGREELNAIGHLAVERDCVIVCDEIHSELIYPGRRHTPMAVLGEEIASRTVTITSATKSFNIPGLRCAVVHFGSERLQERFYRRVPRRLLGAVGIVGVDATVAAWRSAQPWLDRVMAQLRVNRDRVLDVLRTQVPGLVCHVPEATYLAWLDCSRLRLEPTPHRFFLERGGVAMNDGAEFGARYSEFVRLNFATSGEILDTILERMVGAVRSAGVAVGG